MSMCWEEALRARFLANLLVFYIVGGLKGDPIICLNVPMLLCEDYVKILTALK